MNIKESIYLKMLDCYSVPLPESGGILGIKNSVVCEYYHDSSSRIVERALYVLDVDTLNLKIDVWQKSGIEFAGIIHSHMLGQNTLSSGDIEYIKQVFNNIPECVDELYFPIIIPKDEQVISFFAKRSEKDVIIRQDEIHIIK
jgi:hypothetical protein